MVRAIALGSVRSSLHRVGHISCNPLDAFDLLAGALCLGPLGPFDTRHLILHLLGHGFGLLVTQHLEHRRKQFLLVIADMLLEHLLQLSNLAEELTSVLRHTIQLRQEGTRLLVVLDGVSDQVLHPVLIQDRKEVLFLEIGQEVQLLFQIRKQALTGFSCIVRGGEELLEELVGLVRRRLAEGSGGHVAS
jgi:hypothetical protein